MYRRPLLLPSSVLARPERHIPKRRLLDIAATEFSSWTLRPLHAQLYSYRRFLPLIHREAAQLEGQSDASLRETTAELRRQLYRQGHSDELLARCFALIREAAARTVGMRHFDSQLLGGLVLFHGNVAEMHTGEGKTLTATLPAAAAALAGIPVHVITVNEYLSRRDAETMMPIYALLGLSVGSISQEMGPQERRRTYACDVVYCTNKDLVFDYLKDRMALDDKLHPLHLHAERLKGNEGVTRRLLLRGLHFAIVDEADSVLIDEARTPLILSGPEVPNEEQEALYADSLRFASLLEERRHYQVLRNQHAIKLTPEGEDYIHERASKMGPYWSGFKRPVEQVIQALSAQHLFVRDRHYLVRDGKVQIIDEHTGRVMPDRSWERGLHQLIELKEGCELTKPRETLARISYQRFFRLFHHLCGMTGTAKEVAGEMWRVYHLPVVRVPTHRQSRRQHLPSQLYANGEQRWHAVLERIMQMQQQGRPVLVGTHSVAASELLSSVLEEAGLEHQLLNAKQDRDEAQIVARAGQPGLITIATNMAGRGTDIKLAREVEQLGGLHVILTEFHEASRIDRQLEGRCARQGDPGSFEVMVSLDDFLLEGKRGGIWGQLAKSRLLKQLGLQHSVGLFAMKRSQRRLERIHARMRHELLKTDERQGELLSFAGRRV
jgi:preprotein translocase subunit SecA